MEEKRASFTATLMAYYRAYHAMHETPKIFDDFLACHLFTEDEHSFFENACCRLPGCMIPNAPRRSLTKRKP